MPDTLCQDLDVTHLVDALRDAWTHARIASRLHYEPIALSTQDQAVPDGVDNPLWEIVRWLPASRGYWVDGRLSPEFTPFEAFSTPVVRDLLDLGLGRNALCERYAWSIPTPGDVAWMVELIAGRGVVEIGAGSGYWAWQLAQAGVDVVAYDPIPPGPDNRYVKHTTYVDVRPGRADVVDDHSDRALLMVWPPYEGDHAAEALRLYRGDLVIYAGESCGGCTADDAFYDALEAGWSEVGESAAHVSWDGIRCWLRAYARTDAPEVPGV